MAKVLCVKDLSCSQSTDFFCEILSWKIETHPNRKVGIGDSDDESEDLLIEENCSEDQKCGSYAYGDASKMENEGIRIERLVSCISSDCLNKRTKSLRSLDSTISYLLSFLKATSNRLDLPPHYHIDRIALTHKSTNEMISDLTSVKEGSL